MAVELDKPMLDTRPDRPVFMLPQNSPNLFFPQGFEEAYDTFGKRYKGTELFTLFENLLSPVEAEGGGIDLSQVEVKAVSHGSELGRQASDIVNFAYNARYVNNGGSVVDIATDERDFKDTTKIVVAETKLGETSIVLATFRAVPGEDLDLFSLFDIDPEIGWPHATVEGSVPGELGRFSFHPVFDLRGSEDDKAYRVAAGNIKRELLRQMWPTGMSFMKESGVTHPYFILAPHVRGFVHSVGIHPVEIPGVVPSDNEYSQRIRNRFKEYWNPYDDSSKQPKVFLAPWEVVE